MSEFFKALEQAERDRQREEQGETRTTPPVAAAPQAEPLTAPSVPRTTPRENGTLSTEPAVATPVAVAGPLVAKPAPAKPAPTSPIEVAPPVRVFRPSLQAPGRPRRLLRGRRRPPLLIAQTDPSSIEADAYRTVRANIEHMSDNGAYRRIAITSAAGGDGKSTTAANLAVVAAQGGRRVCLVDADIRRPSLHEVFGLSNVDGLALALEQGMPLHAVARPADTENLSIVVAGRGPGEMFHDLFTVQRLERVLRESEAAFDVVFFDSPPVTAVADALSVAAVCDGVILVVRDGSIPFNLLRRAIGQVRQVKGRVLGVLLNRSSSVDSYRYHRSYHTTQAKS